MYYIIKAEHGYHHDYHMIMCPQGLIFTMRLRVSATPFSAPPSLRSERRNACNTTLLAFPPLFIKVAEDDILAVFKLFFFSS